MPIKGVTDVIRIPRLGKIRLGEKAISPKSGKEYPKKLDYFLFDPEDESMLAVAKKLYGEKPRVLHVVFCHNDPDKVFPQYYCCYSAAGLLCKGTGETAMRVVEGKNELEEVECPGPAECEYACEHGVRHGDTVKPGCKRLGRLMFMLPDWPSLGTWEIDTTSWNSIVNVNGALAMMSRIRGIPVELHLVPAEGKDESGKKTHFFALKIVIPHSLLEARKVTPLLGYVQTEPPAEETAPDDLYARSQLKKPIAPSDSQADGPIDPETGEIIDASPSSSTSSPGPAHSLADDPDVLAAMEAAKFGAGKRAAMIQSAIDGEWSKETLLRAIERQLPTGQTTQSTSPSSRRSDAKETARTTQAAAASNTKPTAALNNNPDDEPVLF